MIRTHLVKSLYDNLVGPQNGPTETMEQPYVKYQMGILESCFHSKEMAVPSTETEQLLVEKTLSEKGKKL